MSNASKQSDIMIPGEKIYLGPLRSELVPLYTSWVNDLNVTRTLALKSPITVDDEREWYDAIRKNPREAHFTIYERTSDQPVGNIALKGIDHQDSTAEVGIIIGEKSVWGHGYGTEATRLIVDFAFTVLNLNHVWLRFVAINERGRRAYERVGFREAGRLREAWKIGDTRHDVIFMDILAREFTSPVLAKMLENPEPTVT